MKRLTWIATLLGIAWSAPLRAQEPQYGLRLDARSSMQWSADTLMLQGKTGSFQRLPVDSIYDVWLGPTRGAFVVVSRKGLGLLIGPSITPSALPFEAGALLRSSRPEVVVACVSGNEGRAHRRFIEWRSGGMQRELLEAPDEVVDFDVDVPGRLVMLTRDRRIIATDGQRFSVVKLNAAGAPLSGVPLRRVFLDAAGSEIAVLTDRALFRLNTQAGTWTSVPLNPRVDALVRHGASRRMRVEPRFIIR